MQTNNFSHPSRKTSDALMCQADYKNQHEFNNAVLEAADNAGCQFLFEVPAEFFGMENSRAAAIKLNAYHEADQLAFIMCDTDTGVIHVLSNDEAPSRVLRFVESYANVLSMLHNSNITSH